MSLSRLNHGLPWGEDEPGMMEGTAEVAHPIADVHLPEAAAVFDAATALDTALARVDPQPTLMERLVRHVLVPRAPLPQIEINSIALPSSPHSFPRWRVTAAEPGSMFESVTEQGRSVSIRSGTTSFLGRSGSKMCAMRPPRSGYGLPMPERNSRN